MLDFLTRNPQLRAGRFGQLSVTKQLGSNIDFIWPCINSGDGDGTAFIHVTEPATGAIWLGQAFTIPAKATVPLTLRQNNLNLPIGVHSLIAEMREGIFSNRIIASESVTLISVTASPVLNAVGLPVVNGIPGELLPAGPLLVQGGDSILFAWPCENSGGVAGQAKLQTNQFQGNLGSLTTIPAYSSQTLIIAQSTIFFMVGIIYTVNLSMIDANGVTLATFALSVGVL